MAGETAVVYRERQERPGFRPGGPVRLGWLVPVWACAALLAAVGAGWVLVLPVLGDLFAVGLYAWATWFGAPLFALTWFCVAGAVPRPRHGLFGALLLAWVLPWLALPADGIDGRAPAILLVFGLLPVAASLAVLSLVVQARNAQRSASEDAPAAT